jgi:hypothetical protein
MTEGEQKELDDLKWRVELYKNSHEQGWQIAARLAKQLLREHKSYMPVFLESSDPINAEDLAQKFLIFLQQNETT